MIRSFDDFGLEKRQDAGQRSVKDRPLVGAVGEQLCEKGEQAEQRRQQSQAAVAILNVGGGNDAVQEQALRIDKNVPFLAYAIASSNVSLFSTLLNCGADPNTVLPSRSDKDFLALLPNGLRSYIEEDRSVTMLMLASGLGQADYLRALIDGGANRTRLTTRNKMSALDVAAETSHWRSAQILLGGGPAPDKLRVEISLAMQSVALVRDGKPIYHARCSTGRSGYSTKRGEFVITNKERNHRSTIYHVEMPYFMRLSCLDFGMHAGYVPNYPASHGCIRLPADTARKFFSEIPVGTLVTVQ